MWQSIALQPIDPIEKSAPVEHSNDSLFWKWTDKIHDRVGCVVLFFWSVCRDFHAAVIQLVVVDIQHSWWSLTDLFMIQVFLFAFVVRGCLLCVCCECCEWRMWSAAAAWQFQLLSTLVSQKMNLVITFLLCSSGWLRQFSSGGLTLAKTASALAASKSNQISLYSPLQNLRGPQSAYNKAKT